MILFLIALFIFIKYSTTWWMFCICVLAFIGPKISKDSEFEESIRRDTEDEYFKKQQTYEEEKINKKSKKDWKWGGFKDDNR